jgi:muconolactone delta-isomerase
MVNFMKYLVTWKTNPIPPNMAKIAIELLKASKAQIDKDINEGTITEFLLYTDQSGGVAIIESESNDALYQRLGNEPFAPFLEFCVTPLADYEAGINTVLSNLEKMIG